MNLSRQVRLHVGEHDKTRNESSRSWERYPHRNLLDDPRNEAKLSLDSFPIVSLPGATCGMSSFGGERQTQVSSGSGDSKELRRIICVGGEYLHQQVAKMTSVCEVSVSDMKSCSRTFRVWKLSSHK